MVTVLQLKKLIAYDSRIIVIIIESKGTLKPQYFDNPSPGKRLFGKKNHL